jgi:threonine aldolase
VKIIDLRSDTVTHPTEEMRRAMYEAKVGDDVYGEDPTVNALEQLAAQMMKKEAALFTASGTMSNFLAVLTQTRRGDEIIVGSEAHMFWYEVGGASALGGVVLRTVPNETDGRIDLAAIESAIRGKNIHFPPTTLLCLENTHNRCGGAVITPEYTASAARLAHQHGLRVHLDGARIFNAAIALGVPVSKLVKEADSVCFCLSKGLSAPVGSLLCGTRDFVDGARKWRKMIGGGMRQAGVIAAAGIVALKTMIDRLAEDHQNAQHLAQGLGRIPGIIMSRPDAPTNIVLFELIPAVPGLEFLRRAEARGVKLSHRGGQQFRAVTHRMVSAADIDEALNRIEPCFKKRPTKPSGSGGAA